MNGICTSRYREKDAFILDVHKKARALAG